MQQPQYSPYYVMPAAGYSHPTSAAGGDSMVPSYAAPPIYGAPPAPGSGSTQYGYGAPVNAPPNASVPYPRGYASPTQYPAPAHSETNFYDRSTPVRSPAQQNAPSPTGPESPAYVTFPVPPPKDEEKSERTLELESGLRVTASTDDNKLRLLFRVSDGAFISACIGGRTARGIVLGTAQGELLWQERGTRFPVYMPRPAVPTIELLPQGRCKHCGLIIPLDESHDHVATHKRGGTGGTQVANAVFGTCCGDIELVRNLRKISRLGSGAQGDVWLCHLATDAHRQFVLKEIKCKDDAEAKGRYQQSVRLMDLKHDHLIRYLAVQLQPSSPICCVIMPFYAEKDLATHIRNAKSRFDESYIGSLGLQIACALRFLHSHNPPIIHGDIKPENILMTNNKDQVLLMDLDTSVELVGNVHQIAVKEGTTAWMAPEAINEHRATPLSDIWSLGLVVFVLAVLPEYPMIENELVNATRWSKSAELTFHVETLMRTRGYSAPFAKLVASMLSHDEKLRPTATVLEEQLTVVMTLLLTGGSLVE